MPIQYGGPSLAAPKTTTATKTTATKTASAPSVGTTGTAATSTPTGYAGLYQEQQALAEKAYADAMAQLDSQRQQLYLDYGFDQSGNPNANTPYGAYQVLEHDYGTSLGNLNRTATETRRDTQLGLDDLRHTYDTTLNSYGLAEGDTRADSTRALEGLSHDYQTGLRDLDTRSGDIQGDANTALSRSSRDYQLALGDSGTQRSRLAQAFSRGRRDTLLAGANDLDAARYAGLSRGLGTTGLGGRQGTQIRTALNHGLGDLRANFDAGNQDLDRDRQRLDASYGDTQEDVRSSLARAMRDIGTGRGDLGYDYNQGVSGVNTGLERALRDLGLSRDNLGYQYQQNKGGLERSLGDFENQYNASLSDLNFQQGAQKATLGSNFARALAANATGYQQAGQTKAQQLAAAKMAIIKQATEANDLSLSSLYSMFGN
jgi:hypothetical protein